MPIDLHDLRVLVVDDNGTNRRILEDILTHWGMRPTSAASGEAALDILEEARNAAEAFGLVLLDANMPVMDGFVVAERIREKPALAVATIMMLASSGLRGDAARCRELGVAAYLVKPIRPPELLDAIFAVLAQSPLRLDQPTLVTRHSLREARTKLRILVAEDNPVNQELVLRLLEKRGHEVVVVKNGREALEALKNQPFDRVVLDVQMPEVDGFEATAAIRKKEHATGARLPIIAMTAHAMKGDRERCLAAGMDGYIAKPIDAAEFLSVVEGEHPVATANGKGLAPGASDVAVFDRRAALERVDGDTKLLQELAQIFVQECEKLLSAIREAMTREDCESLERTAHVLKSAVGNFAAWPALKAAATVERIGREGDLARAPEAYSVLVEESLRLPAALATLQEEETGR